MSRACSACGGFLFLPPSACAQILYTYPNNPRAAKALIAAKYGNVHIEVPADFQMNVTNKTEAFKRLNPVCKVPTLQTPEGGIFESNAIARYVARVGNCGLLGASPYEEGLVDAWLAYTNNEIDLPRAAWLYPIFGYAPFSKEGLKQAKADIQKVLATLNEYLATRTYLVGERVTLADIVVGTTLLDMYRTVFDAAFRAEFVHTNRWFNTLVHQPQWIEVIGAVELCTTAMAYDPAKAAAAQAAPAAAAAAADKKDGKKDGKKKGKKDDDEAEEDDMAQFEDPKPKTDEFSGLAPSSFDLDAWKKKYSNSDTRTEAMPWFWQNYENSGYSIWKMDYKYNSELTMTFKASNLVSGLYQRLPKLHKYAFASTLIMGTDNRLQISGIWIFRGPRLPQMFIDECDDHAAFNWTQLDPARDRALIEDYFAWNGASLPAEVADGKAYK